MRNLRACLHAHVALTAMGFFWENWSNILLPCEGGKMFLLFPQRLLSNFNLYLAQTEPHKTPQPKRVNCSSRQDSYYRSTGRNTLQSNQVTYKLKRLRAKYLWQSVLENGCRYIENCAINSCLCSCVVIRYEDIRLHNKMHSCSVFPKWCCHNFRAILQILNTIFKRGLEQQHYTQTFLICGNSFSFFVHFI